VETFGTLEDALRRLREETKVFVIGGGVVFSSVLGRADELYLTIIPRAVEADAFFPPYEHLLGTVFQLVRRDDHGEFVFEDYVRVPAV
jgi:dihydrofolate reductase